MPLFCLTLGKLWGHLKSCDLWAKNVIKGATIAYIIWLLHLQLTGEMQKKVFIKKDKY